jgi:hypothetical protein
LSRRRIVVVGLGLAALAALNAWWVSSRIGTRIDKSALQRQWAAPAPGVQTLVAARFQPGAPDGLALLAGNGVRLLSADGKALARLDETGGITASATGDMDGDGADEVWIVRKSGPPYFADALGSGLETKLKVALPGFSLPVRILPVDLDGDGRAEIVAADDQGSFGACDRQGRRMWTYLPPRGASPADREVRGLDDVKAGKERRVAVAHQGGSVAVLDRAGREVWRKDVGKLRRLRSFDVDGDGSGEVLLGTESGQYVAQGPTGSLVHVFALGEAVTEIRPVEVDGDPRRAEVFLGGRRGAVAVLRGGEALFRDALGARVSSARGIDTDGDGRDEIFVGTENGTLHALGGDGRRMTATRVGGKGDAVASAVSPLRERFAVVGGGPTVAAFRLSRSPAPAWYNPWTAAALAWVAIAGVAAVLLRLPSPLPAAPPPRPRPADGATRALQAAEARIRSWVAAGKLGPEDAADRLEQIRKQAAASARARRAPLPASPPPPRRR